jgi:hypothetical protein
MDGGGEQFSEYGGLLAGAEVGELELAQEGDDFLAFAAEFAGEDVEGVVVSDDLRSVLDHRAFCGLHGQFSLRRRFGAGEMARSDH